MHKFKFRQVDSIGAVAAEEDREFLRHCFVDTGDLEVLRNCKDPRRLVVGRVGSGKSALIQQLVETEQRVITIAPESLALGYVSNSTILTFVASLGVNLDIFFRLLWRHVLTVEILRTHFDIHSPNTKGGLVEWIRARLRADKHKRAVDHLETWGRTFWEDTDDRIKEVTTKVEGEIKGDVPFDVDIRRRLQ